MSIHTKTSCYTTPLLDATKNDDVVECRRLLETEKADVHQRDVLGLSPIIMGSLRGYLDIVELLLSKGAKIHDKDIFGNTSIKLVSAHGQVEAVEFLLSKGASLQGTNNDGETCFSLARNATSHSNYPNPYSKHGILYRLRKWPTTMAILVLTELALIYRIDSSSLIDRHQCIRKEDFTFDEEDSYAL